MSPERKEEIRKASQFVFWTLLGFGSACFTLGYIVAKIMFGG